MRMMIEEDDDDGAEEEEPPEHEDDDDVTGISYLFFKFSRCLSTLFFDLVAAPDKYETIITQNQF